MIGFLTIIAICGALAVHFYLEWKAEERWQNYISYQRIARTYVPQLVLQDREMCRLTGEAFDPERSFDEACRAMGVNQSDWT